MEKIEDFQIYDRDNKVKNVHLILNIQFTHLKETKNRTFYQINVYLVHDLLSLK